MFAAGPGTITAVVTLAAVHTPDGLPMTAIIAAVVGTTVTFVALILAVRLGPRLALQLPFPKISESMGNHDSKIVDADSVD